ncbi:MAG: 50S ribosomal protein L10 [Candidatus Moeniiplasma glomeromycotorum]|nr:50S ribosomal protein L10 [Candidatus Moeniiplasma glomeromycotorum]MCE8167107.1 50S ribosomal protein L10 [Candidatus Moeniiplasma glomeromycotorum]MCE8168881.1 50S ribosomal protein L10 [Candidatus Moeniiplasma glomeromycotorum]
MSQLAVKRDIVQNIQTSFANSPTVLAWDFRYLENETLFQLKRELAQVPAQFKVYKNSLITRALPDYSLTLQNSTALIFAPAQTLPKILNLLNQFQPPHSPIKRFKIGWEEKKVIEVPQLEKWATLPSQAVLMSNLCFSLQWPLRRLVNILGQIKKTEK